MIDVLSGPLVATVKVLLAVLIVWVWLPSRLFPSSGLQGWDRLAANLVHMTALTIGLVHLLALLNLYGISSFLLGLLLLKLGLVVHRYGRFPLRELIRWRRDVTLIGLRLLDKQITPRDVLRPALDRRAATLRRWLPADPGHGLWLALLAAVLLYGSYFRLRGPFTGLTLTVPDQYVHLLWVKLLRESRLLDEAWGVYPRGLHSLLLVLADLTNLDDVSVLTLVGSLASVLFVVAVFYAVYSFTRSYPAAILAALIFASLTGGTGQAALAGKYVTADYVLSARMPVVRLAGLEFIYVPDHLLDRQASPLLDWMFVRQTSALPQELATILLLPSLVFALRFVLTRQWIWLLLYAETLFVVFMVHPGLGMVLAFPSLGLGVAALLAGCPGGLPRLVAAGGAATLMGNVWILGVLVVGMPQRVGGAAPFLDQLLAKNGHGLTPPAQPLYLSFPTALGVLLLLALIVIALAPSLPRPARLAGLTFAFGFMILVPLLYASNLGAMQIVRPVRLVLPVALLACTVVGYAVHGLGLRMVTLHGRPLRTAVALGLVVATAVAWHVTYPPAWVPRERTGIEYATFPSAVRQIGRKYQPFTWTVVSYVQQYPQVLDRGFHVNAHEFLETHDPAALRLDIPTRRVFVFLEKEPHPFQFGEEWFYRHRGDVQRRLHEWVSAYMVHHDDIHLWHEDAKTLIYLIER